MYYNSDKTTNDQQLAQMIQEALINETGAKKVVEFDQIMV